MNDYKRVEGVLHSYKSIQASIKNLHLQIEDIKDDVSISSSNFDAVDSGKCDSKGNSSKVETEALQRQHRIALIQREIRSKERLVQRVDNALETLTDDDKHLVRLRYFDKVDMNALAIRYNLSNRGMYHKKTIIIRQLIDIL
ncbi:MAG: hypothetical protein RR744_09870 [Cellulosilyticaceae bacterium]